MSKKLSDIVKGNYNYCNTCRWMVEGDCSKLNKDVTAEMDSDIRVDDCPRKSGRHRYN